MTEQLKQKCNSIKRRFLTMYKNASSGHVGCSLSCAEMLTFAKFSWMKEGDELVLSKGHAAAALYSTMIEAGDIDEEEADSFYKNNTYLAGHPPFNKLKGIPFATGSLGHGLSIAAGLAMGAKLKKTSQQVVCITSDGEINEGSTWEAALFIAHHRLTNLIWMIDRNFLQGFGYTEDVLSLEPLAQKLEAFGFYVQSIPGHDFAAYEKVKNEWEKMPKEKPLVVICNTLKGNHWQTLEGKVDVHYLPMKEEDFQNIMSQINE